MTRRFIFADTSVLLNFICAGEQDLLLKFVGNDKLHVPAAVNDEMHRKLKPDLGQFSAEVRGR